MYVVRLGLQPSYQVVWWDCSPLHKNSSGSRTLRSYKRLELTIHCVKRGLEVMATNTQKDGRHNDKVTRAKIESTPSLETWYVKETKFCFRGVYIHSSLFITNNMKRPGEPAQADLQKHKAAPSTSRAGRSPFQTVTSHFQSSPTPPAVSQAN